MSSIGRSQQSSQSQSSGRSFVDPSQQPYLNFLRSGAQGVAAGQLGAIGDAAGQLSGQLGGVGQGLLGNLQGIAGGSGPYGAALQQAIGGAVNGTAPGAGFLQQRLTQENPFLNQQIAALGQELGTQFQESLLPSIRRNAVSVGALGGARQGIAEGLAAEGVTRQFAQQAANLRAGDLAQRQAAAQALQQNALQGGALAGQAGALQAQSASSGIGALGSLFNLGLAPFGAQFAPLQALAGIIGGPTVLSEQQGSSSSSGSAFELGFGSGQSPFL